MKDPAFNVSSTSQIAEYLSEYWSTYNSAFTDTDSFSFKTALDDALYGIGVAINKEEFEGEQGYEKFKEFLFEYLRHEL